MTIEVEVSDESGYSHISLLSDVELNAVIAYSKPQKEVAKMLGEKYTSSLVRFYGSELVDVLEEDRFDELSNTAADLVMAVWVYESTYCGLNEETFLNSDLKFMKVGELDASYERTIVKDKGYRL